MSGVSVLASPERPEAPARPARGGSAALTDRRETFASFAVRPFQRQRRESRRLRRWRRASCTWTSVESPTRISPLRFLNSSARISFLSGGGAISYAESTLGVVEAYKLGDVVGEPSAGTNGMVNPFVLPGGYTVGWTGMLVQKRDGTPHHGVGVRPTVPVSPTVAGLRAGRDEMLEKAISLVTRPLTP